MIKEVKAIAILCDCCGRQMKDTNGCNIYEDRIGKSEIEEGWYRNFHSHKDYCPDCWKLEEREVEIDDSFENVAYVVVKNGEMFEYEW